MTTRNQALTFVLLCTVSVLFWWHSLIITFGLALANDAYTHILLILPLGLALIYLDSKELRIDTYPAPGGGVALLALALLIGCYAKWQMGDATGAATNNVRLSLSMLALVVWWIASVLFCFGLRAVRSLLYPLCFLFLIVPVPDFVLNAIIGWLQHGSAWMAALLFRVIGEPVHRNGILVSLSNLDLEVAKECSSIRSSCLLLVTAIVLAHLFLRSWWRKALLIAAAIPLSVAKNGLRITTIGELGTRVDPGFLDGKLHHDGGIVFFGIAVVAVGVLLWILRRTDLPMPLPRPG